jgi:hypothetical protein
VIPSDETVTSRPTKGGDLAFVLDAEGQEEIRRARSLYGSEGFVAGGVLRGSFWTEDESLVVISLLGREYRA